MNINLELFITFCILLMGSIFCSICSSSNFHRFPESPVVNVLYFVDIILVIQVCSCLCF